MRLFHTPSKIRFRFDDPNLVALAGLVPVMALAERCGLAKLADRLLTVPGSVGANAGAKVSAIVAGMVAGADSIEDLDVLRHGAMGRLFAGVRAPSTLGTFLRALRWGHVRQLEKVVRAVTAALPRQAPVLSDAATYALVDADSTVRRVFGYAKQGASYGYTKVKGLHPLLTVVSTPTCAPLVAATGCVRAAPPPAAGPARSSPRRCRPPAPPARPGWCSSAPTRRSTRRRSSRRAAAPAPTSRSRSG